MLEQMQYPSRRIWLKTISVVVMVTFFYQQIAWAVDFSSLLERREWGRSESGYSGKSERLREELIQRKQEEEELFNRGTSKIDEQLDQSLQNLRRKKKLPEEE